MKKNYKDVSKNLISKLIKRGGKLRGERIFLDVLRNIKKKEKSRGINLILNSIENLSPKVMVISKKVAGSRYQIPVPIKENKEFGLGCSWLINSVSSIKKGKIEENLLKEIYLAKNKEGEVVKKKNALHQVAIKNIAFLKFLG